ncbi:MAG TPA: ATPase, T2SS/T4P/T4SS family, partial [Acidimicrobiia bacterium]|nr:ATPase, T2SS/T4P/T4SS family [Acidimicrobiia bacterium]
MAVPIDELLSKMCEVDASDLHLKVGSPPVMRIDGELHPTSLPTLAPPDTESFAEAVFSDRAAEEFRATGEADFAYGKSKLGRFRVNVYRQRGSVSLVIRRVLSESPGFEDLGLPPVLSKLASEPRGLVLVTGPTGSGKTTTLAAIIDYINSSRRVNILTIEDPIEVLHSDKLGIVSQREIGVDTEDFGEALKRVMRQDPDIIMIGEMRDAETVRAALKA